MQEIDNVARILKEAETKRKLLEVWNMVRHPAKLSYILAKMQHPFCLSIKDMTNMYKPG